MPHDQTERSARWARELTEGGTVVFRQRRGPALALLLGALALVLLVVVLLTISSGGDPVQALWSPDLGLVLFVVVVGFVPPLIYRLLTGRPRLEVGPKGLRYGRFHTVWSQVGTVRLANGTLVEVAAKDKAHRCFLLDNRAHAPRGPGQGVVDLAVARRPERRDRGLDRGRATPTPGPAPPRAMTRDRGQRSTGSSTSATSPPSSRGDRGPSGWYHL